MENEDISTGTTIMAFKYKDGVFLAADSRTSSGVYVASRITDKLDQICENIIFCRSGSAADTQRIQRTVQSEIKKLSLIEGTVPSVDKASRLVSKIIYENKEHLLAALIVAGYDTVPRINKINVCGTIEKNLDIALGGSGSGFIYGFCQVHYQPDMELEAAIQFAKKAISLAITFDNASGGVIRMASITKDKVTRYFVPGDQILNK